MSLPPSKIIGCEFSGTVADPKASSFHKGDRIAGVIHGCKDSRTGGFADFLVADPGMCFLVPQRVGLEEACTLGVGWMSATQALQQRLFEEVDEGGKGLGERDAVSLRSLAGLLLLGTETETRMSVSVSVSVFVSVSVSVSVPLFHECMHR